MSIIKTTLKLWLEAPGKPPLWKCAMVAWVLASQAPLIHQTSEMGGVQLEVDVEFDHHEERVPTLG